MTVVVSVQMTATCQADPQNIHMTSIDCPDVTHFSVYLRGQDGCAIHQEDYCIWHPSAKQMIFASALVKAARLSQQYKIPIEPIL